METSHIPWHTAFIEAMQMELMPYLDILEFIPEFQLSTEPLRIDCVVIKKKKDAAIDKNIATIFREVNLLEYKSPEDYISISDFYKVYSYACLYVSLNKTPVSSMTISFVESRNPRELLKHLRKTRGYKVEENSPGIYTVVGDIFPIQVIDNRKLPLEENLWLKCLGKRLNRLMAQRFLEEESLQPKDARIQAYKEAIVRANFLAIGEAIRMGKTALSFDEYLEKTGIAAKFEARGVAIVEANAHKYVLGLLSQGLSTDEIRQRLQDMP